MATKIDNLANEIMEGLKEYADLASDDVKKAVRKFFRTAFLYGRNQDNSNLPV